MINPSNIHIKAMRDQEVVIGTASGLKHQGTLVSFSKDNAVIAMIQDGCVFDRFISTDSIEFINMDVQSHGDGE